jgi:peptidoglycan hydrolase-like protein with peptidoglycan-binding domain
MTRRLLISGIVVAVIGAAVAGFVLVSGSGGTGSGAGVGLPPATATVVRTTLVETKTVSGMLGYGDPVPIRAGQRGTLTWIAAVGSSVQRGEPLFKVDERPVVAVYGSLPLYRSLGVGTKGRDVRQFEQNLAALGSAGFTVDDTYTAATATAVRAWQVRLNLPVTGNVEVGQVVFTPGPVRIARHAARVGDMISGEAGQGGAAVLDYTGTTRGVTVELAVADLPLAVKGRAVTVTVPGRGTVKGRISQVGTVVTAQAATPDQGVTPDGTSTAAADESIELAVTIADQKDLGSLDAAPVDVDLVSDRRANVLAVPVVALLALPHGGFGVQVAGEATTGIVAVKTGMFAGGQVEVSGIGIAKGVKVGVPK